MSIDMDKTETPYEKLDVISNLIGQMMIQNAVGDRVSFAKSHDRASSLCFDMARQMEDLGWDTTSA